MANSDNVLRCGLTPKHIDVAELLAITDFTPLVRGGKTERLEGREPARIVVLPFESMAAARAFYDSPEYAKARAARENAAVMNMIIVEGV